MKRFLIALLFAVAASGPALAQSSSKGVVNVDATGPTSSVAAGSQFTGTVTLAVRSGYHINAQKPTEEFLIGTSVTMTPPAGVTVVKTGYPKAEMAQFSFSEEPLAVYEGTVKIPVTMKVDAAAAAGQLTIPGKVRFQACNDQQCLPPSTVDVSFTVDVAAAAAKKQTLTLSGLPPEARVAIDGRDAGRANAQGRFVARDLDVGRHRVRVEMDGFEPWEQNVELTATQPQTVAVSLVSAPEPTVPETEPAPVEPAATTTAEPTPATPVDATPAADTESSGKSSWPIFLGGLVVAFAGIAVALAARRKSRG